VYLDVPVDWGLIAKLVRDAHWTVAPRRLVDAMQARRQASERP